MLYFYLINSVVIDANSIISFFTNLGTNLWRILFFILIAFIIIYFNYGDKIERLLASILKLFSWTGIFTKKLITTHDLQGKLNCAINELKKDRLDLPEKKIKIKWVKNLNRESFIKNGKMIVKLSYSKSTNDNYVRLSMGYIKSAIVPHVRNYMTKDLSDSLDFYYTKKIITLQENKLTLDYYIKSYLSKRLDENNEIQECYSKIEEIDLSGILSRIYLNEIKKIPSKYYPNRLYDPKLVNCVKELLEFIYTIASRKKSVDVPLHHICSEFNINIALIAKQETKSQGYRIYKNIIKNILKSNPDSLYFLSKDTNIKFAKSVVERAKKEFNLSKEFSDEYIITEEGKKRKCFCTLLKKT